MLSNVVQEITHIDIRIYGSREAAGEPVQRNRVDDILQWRRFVCPCDELLTDPSSELITQPSSSLLRRGI